ncbi:MAG: metallophosphoesterase family protein [Candidatus Hodarchaeota archaeon]
MFTLAVISDIHSNLVALESVITDLKENFKDITEIYCLGDIVGYGPNPQECLEIVLNKEKLITRIIKGNHDDYVTRHNTPPQVNPSARIAIEYQIQATSLEFRWELDHLPPCISTKHLDYDANIVLVHGSPQYPLTEYIYPNTLRQENLFTYMKDADIDILFLGHTHIPFVRKLALNKGLKDLLIINPGAVGQPRDNDPRASYAIIDVEERDVIIRRVNYDIDLVTKQMESTCLPITLGLRLYQGK